MIDRRTKVRAKQLKWGLVGVCFLGTAAWVLALFMPQHDFDTEDRPTVELGEPTAYVEDLVGRLEEDPVYVDPLVASTVGETVVTDEVRAAVDASDTSIYVLALPLESGNRNGGAADVLLARVMDAMDEDGFYVLVGQDGNVTTDLLDEEERSIYVPIRLDPTGDQLADALGTVDGEVDDAVGSTGEEFFTSPLWTGLVMGVMFSVPVWFLGKLVRRAARSDRSYLKGFRR